MGDTQDKEPLKPSREKPSLNGNLPTSSNSGDFGYEELSNGLTCPTCQGTGKIPRGQEDDLVALIPYRDDRLKPRRTALYVCIAVFLCMAVAGILCAFLIPRPISFVDDHVDTITVNLTKKTLKLGLMNYINVTNQNFLSLQITNVSLQVISTFKGRVINDQKSEVIANSVPLRAKQRLPIPVNVTVDNDDFPLSFCDPSMGHENGIYMMFQTTVYYHFMFQDSQSSVTHYQLVSCTKETTHEHFHQIKRRRTRNKLSSQREEKR